MMRTPVEIWEGDLFNRRKEAEDLIDYIENVVGRPPMREDGHALVLAIDGTYGQGKTYFLKRLDEHLKATAHVSAFVDAWTDDLEDEPLVALASTLDLALDPWSKKESTVREKVNRFLAATGKVAKIASVGMAKRALGVVVPPLTAEAIGQVVTDLDSDVKAKLADAAGEAAKEAADGSKADARSLMQERISKFRAGQAAIDNMKHALSEVVQALKMAEMRLPITVIVDELDRCRPTYAIKLLEEIKHLFDVDGVVFILGLHGDQLTHSIRAAYGPEFDGAAYLRRFFSRRYRLKEAELEHLVAQQISKRRIDMRRLAAPMVQRQGSKAVGYAEVPWLIAEYMKTYGLSARDVFGVVDALEIALALEGSGRLLLALILPHIIIRITGAAEDTLAPKREPDWNFIVDDRLGSPTPYSLHTYWNELRKLARLTPDQLQAKRQNGENGSSLRIISELNEMIPPEDYGHPSRYGELADTIGRFLPEPVMSGGAVVVSDGVIVTNR